MKDLGDAEVQQLGHTLARNEDIGWLQVTMHDEALLRVTHRSAHLTKQFQAGCHREAVFFAILVDGQAIDVLIVWPYPGYFVGIWVEKSTMNDILLPLCEELGADLIVGSGCAVDLDGRPLR